MRAAETKTASKHESGFSLIELMIAMVVTLIVTGAIYGLLAGGNSAFRREPELADRQQNARIAMAMIATDIENAGLGLPPFVQVFAAQLDGIGPSGEDGIEIIVGLPQCPATPVCARGADTAGVAGTVAVLDTPLGLPACFGLPEPAGPVAAGTPPTRLGAALFPATGSPTFALIGPVTNDGGTTCRPPSTGAFTTTGTTVSVQSDSGPAWWRTLKAPAPAGPPQFVVPVEVIRYAIAPDPNDAPPLGDPNFRHLWRSATGGRSKAANYDDNPVQDPPAANGNWQLVARGINDLQVQYLDGVPGGPKDEPGEFAFDTDYKFIVRQVTVTLSSRVASANIAGFSGTDMNDPAQIRLGQLTSQIVPRQAMLHLQTAPDESAADPQQWK